MSENDWQRRAEREAVAILQETIGDVLPQQRTTLIHLLAVAWLQGVNLGSHETLHLAEQAFERERADLG